MEVAPGANRQYYMINFTRQTGTWEALDYPENITLPEELQQLFKTQQC